MLDLLKLRGIAKIAFAVAPPPKSGAGAPWTTRFVDKTPLLIREGAYLGFKQRVLRVRERASDL